MDASSDPYLPYDGGGDNIPLRELHKRGNTSPCSESSVGMLCMRLGGSGNRQAVVLSAAVCSYLPCLVGMGECNLPSRLGPSLIVCSVAISSASDHIWAPTPSSV